MRMRSRAWTGIWAATAMAVVLSGCGTESDPVFKQATPVLTQKQVDAALLTPQELGRGFVVDRSSKEDDDDGDGMGCLAEIESDLGPEPAAEAEATFKRNGKIPLPIVYNSVASFDTPDQMVAAMDAFIAAVDGCERVKDTNADGSTVNAKVSTDNVRSLEAVDEQVNVRLFGTMTTRNVRVPFGFWVSLARVGNQGVFVGVTDVRAASARLLNKYTIKAVKRLDAVARGEDVGGTEPKKPEKVKPTKTAEPNA
jgi:hypothetical protein